jgi:uncharacterized membrane protein
MRSLGTLGGSSSFATSVNTHRRVVGFSFTAAGLLKPCLWTLGRGMRRLPTLGGDFGRANYLNEFGQIVSTTTTAQGAERATLWTPIAGPLAVAPMDEGAGTQGRRAAWRTPQGEDGPVRPRAHAGQLVPLRECREPGMPCAVRLTIL